MLALAIQFSRCPRVRTLKAEQRVLAARPEGRTTSASVINLESSDCHSTCAEPFAGASECQRLLRKEVIQPHLPVRLPCYDFTPIASPTFDGSLHKGWATGFGCYPLSWCDGRCVQGPGTYSPQRADLRLLATPTSRGRVADPDPN